MRVCGSRKDQGTGSSVLRNTPTTNTPTTNTPTTNIPTTNIPTTNNPTNSHSLPSISHSLISLNWQTRQTFSPLIFPSLTQCPIGRISCVKKHRHLHSSSSSTDLPSLCLLHRFLSMWRINELDPARISTISLIEFWQKVWPTSFTHFVLEKLIFPKIKFAVHNWEPTGSPTPIHLWLHHWLPYLESSLESLYAQISYKMAAALLRWDLRDVSAYKLIHSWHKLMPSSVLEPILSRIVAKLGIFLSKSLHLSKSDSNN